MLPIAEIDAALPKNGLIYEIGCGYGTLAAALAQRAPERQVVGLDFTLKKVGASLSRAANLSFVSGDALGHSYDGAAGAVLSDFLHHLAPESQQNLLRRLTKTLAPEAVIVIKEIDLAGGLRMHLSALWDRILFPHDRIFYHRRADWKTFMENLGWHVRDRPAAPWFPGSTILFVCGRGTG
jgi:SAM-dependent methyltransferase